MHWLIIDTSSPAASLIFCRGPRETKRFFLEKGQSTQDLICFLEEINLKEVEALAVTTGPSAFTSLRVGVALAQGLARGLQCPLYGINSLSAYISEKEGIFASMIDAHIGGGYVMLQEKMGEVFSTVEAPSFVSKHEFKDKFFNCTEIVGPNIAHFGLERSKERISDTQRLIFLADYAQSQGKKESLEMNYVTLPIS